MNITEHPACYTLAAGVLRRLARAEDKSHEGYVAPALHSIWTELKEGETVQ